MTRKHAVLLLTILCDGTLGSSRVSFACLLIIPMNLIRSKRLLSAVGRGADLYCALGGIICNFALFSTWGGGMNLDHDFFFQISKVIEDKKNVFTKIERVFFPDFKCCRPTSTNSDADQSQIIGEDAVKNYWVGYTTPGCR